MIKYLINKYIRKDRLIMSKNTAVFTPGTIPDLTYNKRESEELEKMVNYQLQVGGKIIILSGPSKIGKTVLINKVLDKTKIVMIQGGELTDETDLMLEILKKLSKLPAEQNTIQTLKTSVSANATVDSKLSFWSMVGYKIGITVGAEANKTTQKTFVDDPFERAIDYMIKESYTLVIDDFHYINGDLQKKIIRKLKAPLNNGLRVLLALIPSRTEVIVQKEPDMEFRTTVIDVPLWAKEELEYIPEKGFKALGISLDRSIVDDFINNSFSNPFLMQELCSRLMYEYDIASSIDNTQQDINIEFDNDTIKKIYTAVAKHDSIIQQLELGKTQRGQDRANYELAVNNGEKKVVDLYKIIMMALGALANADKITVADILQTIEAMDIHRTGNGKATPRASDVTVTLKKISKMASEINTKDPVIEYKEDEKTVYMYDSFFSFNLRFHYDSSFG